MKTNDFIAFFPIFCVKSLAVDERELRLHILHRSLHRPREGGLLPPVLLRQGGRRGLVREGAVA